MTATMRMAPVMKRMMMREMAWRRRRGRRPGKYREIVIEWKNGLSRRFRSPGPILSSGWLE
jgi:hypothetical protein